MSNTIVLKKMFKTYGDAVYYKFEDDSWYIRNDDDILQYGWKCIGSIKISKGPPSVYDFTEDVIECVGRQLKRGPPIGFTPGFDIGNHPLSIKETDDRYYFYLGYEIAKVYSPI